MAFEPKLKDSLRSRASQIEHEFAAGDDLEAILSRHLLAVEASADSELVTSILLLDDDGKRLWHAAAPSLPKLYCDAINGIQIGPDVGSCGTAAYLGLAIYVTDIATDPLWKDFRDLALPHGLRACWSTPIRDGDGAMLGTFAIYHRTPRGPTPAEVEAIRLITDHVAEAISRSRSSVDQRQPGVDIAPPKPAPAELRLVASNDLARPAGHVGSAEDGILERLESYAMKLDLFAEMADSPDLVLSLQAAAEDCRSLADSIRSGQRDSSDS